MDKKKLFYEVPAMQIVEIKTEGIVCESPIDSNRNIYGDANEL